MVSDNEERGMEWADIETEREVLSHLFSHPEDPFGIHAQLAPEDFYGLDHQALWEAWRPDMDPYTLAERAGVKEEVVSELMGHWNVAVSQVTSAARRVLDFAGRRRVAGIIADVSTNLHHGASYPVLHDVLLKHASKLDLPLVVGKPDQNIADFTAGTETYDWAIPEFLERQDRLLITAGEGQGKSYLLGQLATQAACGIHPWTLRRVPPIRVVYIDCENGERRVRRRFRDLLAKTPSDFDPDRLRIIARSEGLNLTERTDRMWLLDRMAANEAELLVIGPAYQLYSGVQARGDIGGEDQAKTVVEALNEVRSRFNAAIIMETHSPHGDSRGYRPLRPFGSSVWLRWPEFGIGLRPDAETPGRWKVEHWRGSRDGGVWPLALTRGIGADWPWNPVMPTGTFRSVPNHPDQGAPF
jgi:hypothetical protein